ncbi:PKD domain-containing protein [Actinospica sp. MGRD01-02]|uniref:PKD domain-containing protein n=1 Tax=Actinospica acidithermotolerans TaxID=2828514 RepID=A0A941EE12_9ACTN|nr:PKD domain-containing protein [Actinospica acidithermotolerans]MBR7829701.1 PKD domain-containing protein [Actinospica acidithermotolerans]
MSRRPLAALAAGATLTLVLSPALAEAATAAPHVVKYPGKAAPAPKATTFRAVSPRTTNGLTAAITATSSGARSFSYSATASTDTASTITSYTFDFGDGSNTVTNTTGTTSYEYTRAGTYTATVTVKDAAGTTDTATTSVTTTGSDYTPYGPARLLDTRNGTGEGGTPAKIASDTAVKLKIAGNGSIPAGVTAVTVNITPTNEASGGNIIAYADGATRPTTSNVNFGTGQTVAALATVQVGADGYIDLYNDSPGTIDLIADASGYYTHTSASGYTPITTARILDTRNGTGEGGTPAKIASDGTLTLTIEGADGGLLPSTGVTAVALNLTATTETNNGNIIAYPDNTTRPTTSNVNFSANTNIANYAIVPVGADGKIDLYNESYGTTNLIADVSGYFTATGTSSFVPVTPTRSLDTRTIVKGTVYADTAAQDPYLTLSSNNATAYAITATVTNTTGGGDLIIYPAGTSLPSTSNLNWNTGDTVANSFNAIPGPTGIYAYNQSNGTTDVIIDEYGYYTAN